ncbi:MAG: integration host factor subunit alpha [Mariprofundales bacterium]
MTKAQIADVLNARIGFSKKDSLDLVETVLTTVSQTLASGESVKMSGFGHFMLHEKNARSGRNPKNGSEIAISPRRIVVFRASSLLKSKMISSEGNANA